MYDRSPKDRFLDSLDRCADSEELFDGQWNDAVEDAWLSTLRHVINHMKRDY